jgi:hypothetical protein
VSRIVVLGGRGLIGRRILRLLRQTLPDAELVCAGRKRVYLEGIESVILDVYEPRREALSGADALINCVGPFLYSADPLLDLCDEAGCHWIDLAETPEFMREVRQFNPRNVAAVTGCSSVPALIEVFARRWQGRADVTSVRAQLSIGTNNEASATLLYSMLLPVGQKREHGPAWFTQGWRREHDGHPSRTYATYPSGLEGTGVNLGDRTVPLKFGFGFDRPFYTDTLKFFASLFGATPRGLLKVEAEIGASLSPLLKYFGTPVGIMAIDALDGGGNVIDAVEITAEKNGLDVPSWPSVWAAETLLTRKPRPQGSLALPDLITPEEATIRLHKAGFVVK